VQDERPPLPAFTLIRAQPATLGQTSRGFIHGDGVAQPFPLGAFDFTGRESVVMGEAYDRRAADWRVIDPARRRSVLAGARPDIAPAKRDVL
jgi:hypothetical protein